MKNKSDHVTSLLKTLQLLLLHLGEKRVNNGKQKTPSFGSWNLPDTAPVTVPLRCAPGFSLSPDTLSVCCLRALALAVSSV